MRGWLSIALLLLLVPPPIAGQEVLLSLDARNSRLSLFEDGVLRAAFATPVLVRPEGACGVAFSGYSAFFADATDSDQLIYELNPRDGAVWNTLPMPVAGIDGLAYDQGVLFAQSFAEDRIYRLDAVSGAVLGTLEPGVDLVGGLAAGAGRLFAARLRPPALCELDPRTGQVLKQVPTAAQLPSGLAFSRGRLFVGDYQQSRLSLVYPDAELPEEIAALNVGRVAGLDAGAWTAAPPYRVELVQVGDPLLDEGSVQFSVRAALVDGAGRLLSTNQRSEFRFELQGPGVLLSDPVQRVSAGQVVVQLQMPAGTDARLEASLSGLAPAFLSLRAVPPITRIEVELVPTQEDYSLVQVEARLWDALGNPATEDTGTVQFAVAWGSGILVGVPAVLAQDSRASTWVRRLEGRGQLAVEARVRGIRGRGVWAPPSLLPATPEATGLATTSQRVGSADQSLPAAPTQVRALREGARVELRWQLSPDEGALGWFPYGEAIGRKAGLLGYQVLRNVNGGLYTPLGWVGTGTAVFVDSVGATPAIYRYRVLADEGENLGEEAIAPGSLADQQRTVVVGEGVPVDVGGRPVAGLFNEDLVVDFEDFFLFADHFGARRDQGPGAFDERFDLDGDGSVGLGDFFIFADHFGQVVAGFL